MQVVPMSSPHWYDGMYAFNMMAIQGVPGLDADMPKVHHFMKTTNLMNKAVACVWGLCGPY
jgi:hypothetical protein